MSSQPIDIYQPDAEVGGLKLFRPPAQVLAEAKQAADALEQVITNSKIVPVQFGDKKHLRHEHWELLGHFFGYSTKIEWTRPIKDEDGAIYGYEAAALLINERSGAVVGRAEAMCTGDEENWGEVAKYEYQETYTGDGKKAGKQRVQVGTVAKPIFQLRSMAETRASGQAFRRKLGWVAVLAGYAATPSEEMTRDIPAKSDLPEKLERKTAPDTSQSKPPSAVRTPPKQSPRPVAVISDPQSRRFFALWKDAGKSREQVVAYLRDVIGVDSDKQIPVSRYQEACAWAERG